MATAKKTSSAKKAAPPKTARATKPPAKKAPAKKAPAKKAPSEEGAGQEGASEEGAGQEGASEEGAGQEGAPKKAPVKKAPVKKAPVKKAPVKKAPVKKTPAKKPPTKKAAPVKKATATAATKTTPATTSAAKRKGPSQTSLTPSLLSNAQFERVEIPAPRGHTKDGIAYTKDFDVQFLKAQRDELLARRDGELARATRLEDEATSIIENGEMGDVQFDDEGGEGDTMVVQRDLDRVLSTQARQTILDIDATLARIEQGTYGYSSVSGLPNPARTTRGDPRDDRPRC